MLSLYSGSESRPWSGGRGGRMAAWTVIVKAVAWLLAATFGDAATDTVGAPPGKPPPEYPIPSNCNFVAASTTSPHLRYVPCATLPCWCCSVQLKCLGTYAHPSLISESLVRCVYAATSTRGTVTISAAHRAPQLAGFFCFYLGPGPMTT